MHTDQKCWQLLVHLLQVQQVHPLGQHPLRQEWLFCAMICSSLFQCCMQSRIAGTCCTAGFYRRFVNNFSHIAAPLTNITGAKATWRWSEVEAKAFADLKQALTTTPVLATPDWTPWSELRHTLPGHRRGRPIRPTNVAPIWSSKLATKFYCPDATCAMASWTLCGWGPIPSRSASRAQPIAWVYPPT